jgi:hypothetical protein
MWIGIGAGDQTSGRHRHRGLRRVPDFRPEGGRVHLTGAAKSGKSGVRNDIFAPTVMSRRFAKSRI